MKKCLTELRGHFLGGNVIAFLGVLEPPKIWLFVLVFYRVKRSLFFEKNVFYMFLGLFAISDTF